MSRPAFDCLPSELLLEIFNYTEPGVRYATLKSLALICRSVHGPAMTVLYTVVALRYTNSFIAFADLARSGHFAHYLNLVRHLSFHRVCDQATIYVQEEDRYMACTDIILWNCPNIATIQADSRILVQSCLHTSFVCGFETAFIRLHATHVQLPLTATTALVRLHVDDMDSFALRPGLQYAQIGLQYVQLVREFFTTERFPKLQVFSCRWPPPKTPLWVEVSRRRDVGFQRDIIREVAIAVLKLPFLTRFIVRVADVRTLEELDGIEDARIQHTTHSAVFNYLCHTLWSESVLEKKDVWRQYRT